MMAKLRLSAVLLMGGLLAATPAAAVEVVRVASPGGLEAWLVEDHTNPLISVNFAFRGGAALDPVGKEGLADMVSSLLDEGAGDLDSQAFQGRLEDLAVRLGFDAGQDNFRGNLRTLTENRDAAFDLLRLALTAPRFDSGPVTRIRGQLQARLRRNAEDPDRIASRTLRRALFPDHPYGRPTQGTEESLAAVEAGDLKNFVARRLARDNLVIGVVGDLTATELATLLDATFGALPEAAAPSSVAEIVPDTTGKTIVVRKEVPQSAIAFAQRGIKRDDADFYAAFVMNHMLGGGGFTSRLYAEVREKRGLAYSVYSGLYPLDSAGLIWGGAGTRNAQVAETLEIVRREWRRMAAGDVGAEELADAKTFLTGSYPLRFTSSGRIARMLVGMQLSRLGIDYMDRRNSLIEAVDRNTITRVAKSLLAPDALTVVVVGDPAGLDGKP